MRETKIQHSIIIDIHIIEPEIKNLSQCRTNSELSFGLTMKNELGD